MNTISYWVETIPGGEDEDDTVILHITVTVKDNLQMADEYHFNAEQRKLLEELLQPEYQELFMALTGSYQDIELSPEEIAEIMETLPADLSEERKQIVLTAYQLFGKVHYYRGGKSLVIGRDSRRGMPMEVTAEGSPTTGTVRPFGLLRNGGLGILQSERWAVRCRPRRRSRCPAQLLYRYSMERSPAGRFGILSR